MKRSNIDDQFLEIVSHLKLSSISHNSINFYEGEILGNSFLRNVKYTFLKNNDVTVVKISDICYRAFVINNPEMVC